MTVWESRDGYNLINAMLRRVNRKRYQRVEVFCGCAGDIASAINEYMEQRQEIGVWIKEIRTVAEQGWNQTSAIVVFESFHKIK